MSGPFDPSLRMRPTGVLSVGGSNAGDYETVSWRWEPADNRSSTAAEAEPEYEIVYSPSAIGRPPIGRILVPNYAAEIAAEEAPDGELFVSFEVLELRGALRDVLRSPTTTEKGEVRTWPVTFTGRSYYGSRLSISFPRVELRPDGEVVIGRNSNDFSTIRFTGRVIPDGDGANRFGTVSVAGGGSVSIYHPRVSVAVSGADVTSRRYGVVAGEQLQAAHSRGPTVSVEAVEADLDRPLSALLSRFSSVRSSSDFIGNVEFVCSVNTDLQPVGSPQAGDVWSLSGSLADRLGIAGSYASF